METETVSELSLGGVCRQRKDLNSTLALSCLFLLLLRSVYDVLGGDEKYIQICGAGTEGKRTPT